MILIPSQLELDVARAAMGSIPKLRLELCGFGPIVAAARTSQLLCEHRPEFVLLLGVAGSLANDMQVGEAYEFSQVACYGVGAGAGELFQTAGEIGWQQWPQPPEVGDALPLTVSTEHRLLLTCCAASGNLGDVAHRLAKYPQANAEDMEGFAVAVACRLAGIPLRIIRGISNVAGYRDHRQWKIQEAMAAAVALSKQVLESLEP